MTINHNVPSTTRKPGVYHEFDLTSSAQSLVPLTNRVLLIGVQGSTATATADEVSQVFDELTADAAYEAGSEVALMIRKALETGRALGVQPEIYAAGIADPGGTAATYTITVSAGTAVAGDIVFRIGEVAFRAGVSTGDDENAVATAIANAVDGKLAQIPVTQGTVANVVTLTLNYTGENGNDLIVQIDDVGLTGMTVVAAAGVAGAGVSTPTTALANALVGDFESVAISNRKSADVTLLQTHLTAAWAASAKRWRFGFIGSNDTLSTETTLAGTANDERICVTTYEQSPSMPMQIAACMAVTVSARELPNFNWDGQEVPLALPPDASAYTDTEIETAIAAGATPLSPNNARTATEVVRLLTTKTLEGGNPFENVRDLAIMRGLVFTTRQIDVQLTQQFKGVNKSAQVLKRIRSVTFGVLKSLEAIGVTQNVDSLFPQLVVEQDPFVATRAVINVPESIIPNLHQIVTKHVLFVQ